MPVINILSQSDPSKSIDENSASLINMYLTMDGNNGKYQVNAYPTPGLTTFATINSPVRALFEEHGVLYAVGGNTFYSIASNGTPTTIGTIASSTGWAKIVGINNELLITDSTNGYYYKISTNTFQAIPTGQVVQFITVANAGIGYINPIATFSGGGAVTQATANVLVSGGFITGVIITNAGSGYTTAPNITITDTGATGSGATATAVLTAGAITSITVTAGGSNYAAPHAVITDTTGVQATAQVVTTNGVVTSVVMLTNGSGYTAPTVQIVDGGINALAVPTMEANSYPTAIQDVNAQDEFGLAIIQNSQTWNASQISDLSTWPALSFASVTGNQNNLVGLCSIHREIYLFSTDTLEVWDNLGNANFTFGRNQSVYIEWGCAARSSIAKGNNTAIFLGQSITGNVQVMQLNGYNAPMSISTPALNYQLSTYATISDAVGFCYQQEGHEFYVLTFPTQGVTWVYDFSMQAWHQRQSSVSGIQTRWLPSCYANCYTLPLVGDFNSGNIYKLDMTNFTENGTAITRTIISNPFYAAGVWNYLSRLQVDVDNGEALVGNTLNLFVSRDGGRTYGAAKPNTLAGAGNTISGPRIWWARLGAAKIFVLQIQTTMNAKFIVLGAWATFSAGEF